MKYDDASWHFASTPEGADDERWKVAAAHIGAYMKCCLLRGWAGEIHTTDETSAEAVAAVRSGAMSGTEFCITYCDCKFTDEDLTEEGNAFTAYYYEGAYLDDAEQVIDGQLLASSEESYDGERLQTIFDQRYSEWVSTGRPAKKTKKAWWKF